jgi:putative salt-induced outer membrane protein YdiY
MPASSRGLTTDRVMTVRIHLVFFLALSCCAVHSQDNQPNKQTNAKSIDVIVMKNGDRLSGEIKKIEHGLLYIETPYISGEQVAVDWLQVEKIESQRPYRVELDTGKRLIGRIQSESSTGSDKPSFTIVAEDAETKVTREEVIGMGWQKENFFRQLKGNIDLGYSFTSGNEQVQGNLNATSTFDSPKYRMEGNLNSTISVVSGTNEINRQQVTTLFGKYLSRRDMVFGAADFLKSSQQKLDLRSTRAAGYGRGFIKTPRTELNLRAGLAYNHESYVPSAGIQPFHSSIESLFYLGYSTFRFNRSEFNLNVSAMPSLSDAGRVRSNVNSSYSVKLVNNFRFVVSLWDTYDSRPPIAAKKNELGLSTGLGWTY